VSIWNTPIKAGPWQWCWLAAQMIACISVCAWISQNYRLNFILVVFGMCLALLLLEVPIYLLGWQHVRPMLFRLFDQSRDRRE
jgi:hypothetical protein